MGLGIAKLRAVPAQLSQKIALLDGSVPSRIAIDHYCQELLT